MGFNRAGLEFPVTWRLVRRNPAFPQRLLPAIVLVMSEPSSLESLPLVWGGRQLVARLGWAGVVSCVLVGVMGAMTTWQLGRGPAFPWPTGSILLLVGVVWAAAVAAAAALPVVGYAAAGLWLAWHGVSLMAPWAGTPLMALPVIWVLGVMLTMLAWKGPRHKTAWLAFWLVIAGLAGWVLAEMTGWNRLLGRASGTPPWIGPLILGTTIAWAGVKLRPVLRRLEWTEPAFGRVWIGGLAVMAMGLGASAFRDMTAAEGWAWGVVEASAPWAALAWFWLGGIFATFLAKGACWATGPWVRGWARNSARWILPSLWLGVTLLEWLATHSSGGLAGALPQVAVQWVQSWPDRWQMAIQAHAWTGVVVVILGLGFLRRGRESVQTLHRLNALWMAALAGLAAVGDTLTGAVAPAGFPWGAGLLGLIGLPAILVVLASGETKEARNSAPYQSGVVVCFMGMLLAMEWQSLVPWSLRAGPAALLGMIHLPIPFVLYGWWTGGRKMEGQLSLSTQAWLIFAGLLCVLPILHRDPFNAAQLACCPVLWFAVLLWLRWRQPGLTMASGGLAGACLGSATVAAWSRPALLLPEVPWFDWLNPPAVVFAPMDPGADRPFMDPRHFILFLVLTAAGAVLGALTFRPKSGPEVPRWVVLEADDLPAEGSLT